LILFVSLVVFLIHQDLYFLDGCCALALLHAKQFRIENPHRRKMRLRLVVVVVFLFLDKNSTLLDGLRV
jgi:hypothetical protein